MRLMLFLVILSVVLSGCATGQLPDPPSGNTCIGDVENGGFDCSPIPQDGKELEKMLDTEPRSLIVSVKLKAQADGSFVPFADVDNWVAFDPITWSNIQNYIGDLKVLAQKQCR